MTKYGDSGYQLEARENLANGSWTGTIYFKGLKVSEVTGPNRELLIANAKVEKSQHLNRPAGELIDL